MKTAAGVLILVVAASNLIGGFGYALGGAIMGGIGVVGEELSKSEEFKEDAGLSDKGSEDLAEGSSMAMKLGGSVVLWGVFLFVLAGLQIAAGVQLFRAKGALLIFIAAGLEILSDVVTIAMAGTFLMAGLGLVAAIMAILSAKEFSAVPAPVMEPVSEPGNAEADSD